MKPKGARDGPRASEASPSTALPPAQSREAPKPSGIKGASPPTLPAQHRWLHGVHPSGSELGSTPGSTRQWRGITRWDREQGGSKQPSVLHGQQRPLVETRPLGKARGNPQQCLLKKISTKGNKSEHLSIMGSSSYYPTGQGAGREGRGRGAGLQGARLPAGSRPKPMPRRWPPGMYLGLPSTPAWDSKDYI